MLLTGCAGSRTRFAMIYAVQISFMRLRMASSASQTALNKRPMPYQSLEEEVAILRTKAEKLRDMASAHSTP